jgi:membrane protease YdiL (CAAX protease family)
VIAFACVETAIAAGRPAIGQAADALLLFVLVNVGLRTPAKGAGKAADVSSASWALALVCLARVVGLALPAADWSEGATLLVLALLVGLSALRLMPLVGINRRALLNQRDRSTWLPAMIVGLVMGLAAFLAGSPVIVRSGTNMGAMTVAFFGWIAAVGVEELVFRGLVQVSLQRLSPRFGIITAVGLSASTYLGFHSGLLVLVMVVSGLTFARAVHRSGSVSPAIAGHVVLAISAGVLWPAVLGWDPRPRPSQLLMYFLLLGTVAVATLAALRSVPDTEVV